MKSSTPRVCYRLGAEQVMLFHISVSSKTCLAQNPGFVRADWVGEVCRRGGSVDCGGSAADGNGSRKVTTKDAKQRERRGR